MSITAQSPADWLLEVNNLSCGYGGDSVVKDVSFALSHGDIGCLLGPSGCGKSTILRALAGFLPLSGGEICLQSQTISLPGARYRRKNGESAWCFRITRCFHT